jgi:hypothetical protein
VASPACRRHRTSTCTSYIDKVDEDGIGKVDLDLDAEYEAARRAVEAALEENARLQVAALRDDFVPVAIGWDVDT